MNYSSMYWKIGNLVQEEMGRTIETDEFHFHKHGNEESIVRRLRDIAMGKVAKKIKLPIAVVEACYQAHLDDLKHNDI